MNKYDVIEYIRERCIIAVVRADTGGEDLLRVVEAVAEGDVHCVEVTMTTPGALRCVEEASARMQDTDACLGVGSVLDGETCRQAILAGARYIVSPTLSRSVIETARRYGVPVIAGGYTPTEMLNAWEWGADMVKLFPANIGGPDYIKSVLGPLPQLLIVPTGGVMLDNVGTFLNAGAAALAVGGNLVSKRLLLDRDFAGITANARAFAHAVERVREHQ